MYTDYLILTVIAVLGIGGGVFLLFEAKRYRARHKRHLPYVDR